MTPQDHGRGRGQRSGRLHKRLFSQTQDQRAHQARHTRHLGDGDGHHHRPHLRAQCRYQRNGQQDGRNGHQAIHETHEHRIDLPKVPSHHAQKSAQRQRQRGGESPHQQRHLCPVNHAAVKVTAKAVGAQPKGVGHRAAVDQGEVTLEARRFVDKVGVHGGRVQGAQPGRQQGHQDHEPEHHGTKPDRAVGP